ncbi:MULTISPECIES: PglD-related sugar-binding protein [Lysinibacillus]|uniref:PglD-related sugar-binding protein n=1 Tax=Lysinibacillus TaxID=400634 RepID=UPI0021A30126|nr:hypothetical protein [Lysinibacillus capsici]MCT1539292.1 hypothetical protein [Lysinibacillus capsici]MCT1570640.1 hypothetical protein [Lysinibacillus capsici]MCT1647452.1 hypothetical protein [Lysinibacillus capsici]MCT1726270.1 hypothetical protein [Lysinibacillus capsici]MCT1783374.1 hypothetical protein [Lysinibacillus capsici]
MIVYGSKEFAHIIKNLIEICGYEFIGFIDDLNPIGESVLGTFEDVINEYSYKEYKIVNGLGYNNLKVRWEIQQKIRNNYYESINLIHPRAIVDSKSVIGEGNIIMAGAIVELNAKINDLVVMWPGSIVNHDSEVSDNCFLSPSSTVCGFVNVGENCFIGAGAVIVNHLNVPANTFVKAGSLYYTKK